MTVYLFDYFHINTTSGLFTYVRLLQKAFEQDKYLQLRFVWLNSSSKYPNVSKTRVEGAYHIYFPSDFNNESFSVHARDYLLNDIGSEKNVILHVNWFNHCAFAKFVQQKVDCTILFTKHCIPWRNCIDTNYSFFKRINSKLLNPLMHISNVPELNSEFLAYSCVDYIICAGGYAKQETEKIFGFSEDRIFVVQHGFDANVEMNSKAMLRKKYGFGKNEKIILCASKIIKRKGIGDLIKAFERLSISDGNLRLIIAGDGEFNKLFSHVNEKWGRITITGNLIQNTLYEFYKLSDIGVVPSYLEYFGYTALEMMYFGLPLIAVNTDGPKEFIPELCALKVELILGETEAHLDNEELQNNLKYYLDNPKIAEQYAQRAKAHTKENHTTTKMIYETVDIYNKIYLRSVAARPHGQSNNPLISIVLAISGDVSHLNCCIESVLLQSYTNLELIIIDRELTNKADAIIKKYHDNRIRYFKSFEDRDTIDSINKGIAQARGEYIGKIESDDFFHKDKLLQQILFLEDPRNKPISFVSTNQIYTSDSGLPIQAARCFATDKEIRISRFFDNRLLGNSTLLIRAGLIKKIKFSRKYQHAEDIWFKFQLLKNGKGSTIGQYLTYHRFTNKGNSAEVLKKRNNSCARILNDELLKVGVNATASELSIQLAIWSRLRGQFFNTNEKKTKAELWVKKVLKQVQKAEEYNTDIINRMHKDILETYCGIYES